jgi:transcriptional regulator of acetoin/glycerol metabolism
LRFSPDVLRVLLHHDWPGNVREMENVLEYAVAVCRGQTILPEDLGTLRPVAAMEHAIPASAPASSAGDATRRGPPNEREGRVLSPAPPADELRRALERHRWRRADAAQELGVSRTTLWRWMRERDLA